MWDGLIATKFIAPPPRADAIQRPRLLQLLERSEEVPATLLLAPAGSGKSTLLADWYRRLEARRHAIAWLSLDPDDNEPLRFLTYLVAALTRAEPRVGARAAALLRSVPVADAESLLPLIVNDLAAVEARVALFVDDLHVLTSPVIAQFLDKLLAYAPRNLSLYLASRSEPTLPLARLRLHQQAVVLTELELRFDLDEAELFLNRRRALALSIEDLRLLHAKTEGWAAGIGLASLSLERRQARSDFLQSFSGTDRDVAEFLAQDVLLRQPDEVQQFLLATSVLTRFDAALAREVTGRADTPQMLERLRGGNLFVVALDDQGRWLRYHHLFADFLRARLERRHPGASVGLHRKAAAWYQAQGEVDAALFHWLAAGDDDRAAAYIDDVAMAYLTRGQLMLIRDWLARLPEAAIRRRPRLGFMESWIGFHMLEPRRAYRALKAARRALGPGAHPMDDAAPSLSPAMLGELRTLIAGTLSAADHNRWARDLALRWLPRLPKDQPFLAGVLSNILAFSHYTLGDMEPAAEAAEQARAVHRRARSVFGIIYADLILALVEKARARLGAAQTLLERARELARATHGSPSYSEALVAVFLGELAYERGDLVEADRLLTENNYIIEGTALIVHALAGHLHLARLAALQGREQSALEILDRAEKLGRDRLYRRLRAGVLNDRVRLLLQMGDLAAAQAALRRAGLQDARLQASAPPPVPAVELERVALARVLLAEQRPDAALKILEDLAARMERQGRERRLAQVNCLKVVALDRMGRRAQAQELLARTLARAEAQGLLRTIADEGRALKPLLSDLLARVSALGGGPPTPAYLQRLLAALAQPGQKPRPAPRPVAATLVEALSPRELDIVRLLAEGRSNAALAEALALSPTTVKWHLKNVYAKLGVGSRTQAVLAAQSLRLLS